MKILAVLSGILLISAVAFAIREIRFHVASKVYDHNR